MEFGSGGFPARASSDGFGECSRVERNVRECVGALRRAGEVFCARGGMGGDVLVLSLGMAGSGCGDGTAKL
ncbi:hypothetical protein GUJ93_ZPchr0002g25842 [Zizania palustris]|uniref:Uncharacterized protein n=1 Tax=Zizania palustris TaxID=103762 RepID=A0A8J5RXW6_ZIZPA|nr:hypothetical protein GUJ93_ZPchr0002g25842 [Zizania palustris]